MTYYLPSNDAKNPPMPAQVATTEPKPECSPNDLQDLRIFWGSEICRLEYLVHLLDTGRVKYENWASGL